MKTLTLIILILSGGFALASLNAQIHPTEINFQRMEYYPENMPTTTWVCNSDETHCWNETIPNEYGDPGRWYREYQEWANNKYATYKKSHKEELK